MLPLLAAIGTGLSVLSSVKTLMSGDSKTASTPAATPAATPPAAGATSSAPGAVSASEQQDRFLKLLVTQMKNQDPLNPLDNAQVTTQLAQIQSVTGIEKLNNTVQGLSQSLMASQSLQSASIIGRQVYASGAYLNLAGGKAAGGVNLPQDVEHVYVSIADQSGAVLRRLDLGAAKAGMSGFEWDGKTDAGTTAPDGQYMFQLTAANGNKVITAEPFMAAKVDGVSLGTAGMKLNLQGGATIGMADVKQIL